MLNNDQEWQRLKPMMKVSDETTFIVLRDRICYSKRIMLSANSIVEALPPKSTVSPSPDLN